MEQTKRLKDIVKGDTFAYEIVNDEEFKGRYLIFWETGIHDERIKNKPLMRLKITKDHNLPKNEEEFQKLEDVITTITFMEARFFPLNFKNMEEDIKEKSKVEVEADEFNYLYTYTISIISFRNIYKKFIYLENYNINWDMKPKEFWPWHPVNIGSAFAYKKDPFRFEEDCLRKYKTYNLRRSSLWKYTPAQRKAREKETEDIINAGRLVKQGVKAKMTVFDLLEKMSDITSQLPMSIKVNNKCYQIVIRYDYYLRKDDNVYRELINDLSANMPPKDWLNLEIEIITDEEYEESLK